MWAIMLLLERIVLLTKVFQITVWLYREHYGKEADESSLHEFFWLFTNGDTELPECWKKMMKLVGNAEYSYEKLRENNPPYENMNDFLKSVK